MSEGAYFTTKAGERVEILCGLEHDFEGWPQRLRVRDTFTGAESIVATIDLRPPGGILGSEFAAQLERFNHVVASLPDCDERR